MRLIIFDTDNSLSLHPLTYLRASFELRCGHSSLGEKIARQAGKADETCYFVRDLLAPTVGERFEDARVNDTGALGGDDLLLVDGRVLALDTLPVPEGDGVVMDGDDPVIVKAGRAAAGSLARTGLDAFLADAVKKLPKADGAVTIIRYPWDLVHHNPGAITADFKAAGKSGIEGDMNTLSCVYGPGELCYVAPGAEIHPMVVLDTKGGPVTIDEGVTVFPHTRIEGPAYIGPDTQIVGGKIREGCSFGPQCRVGGEVEESIIHGYSNKYHDGFLGHAYVCEWVNLGALTTNSDLKNDYGSVEVKIGGTTYDSGSTKVGSFIGDHTKTSIGTLLNTGSFVGVMCLLMASGAPMPKYIPSFSWFLNGRFSRGAGFKSLLKTAHAATDRRGKSLSEADVALLKELFELTREERTPLVRRDSLAMLRK